MKTWRDEAITPHEVRAAKLFEEAARLPVPPPPAFSTLATSAAARGLLRKTALKAVTVVLVGTGVLFAWWSPAPSDVAPQVPAPVVLTRELPPVAEPTLDPTRVEAPSQPQPPPHRARLKALAPLAQAEPSAEEGPLARSSTLGEEAALIASALQALRQENDAPRAVALLVEYRARFPEGVLRPEALLAQAQAERALRHAESALALLDDVGPVANQKLSGELDVTRGELLSELERCESAEAAFSRALATGAHGIAERAAWGRARCGVRRLAPNAGAWLREFLAEYPESSHAPEAMEFLETLPSVK